MKLELICLSAISLIELLLWIRPLWRWRKAMACVVILVLSLTSGLLFGGHPAVWSGLILFFSVYRLINLLRVLEGRLQPGYLFRATRQTSLWLIAVQVLILGLVWLARTHAWAGQRWLYGLAIAQLITALVLYGSARRQLEKTKPRPPKNYSAEGGWPTLSVAIPARNETDDLEACLQSLITSNYPKLEILVLDDCSQNRRTPEIIRGYAHAGIRFIAGKAPPKNWLAKNYAYDQLAEAANGELLLFCGVDTRFQAGSLQAMVQTLLQKNKLMMSFIPKNKTPGSFNIEALLIQPARYAWELALPRRLFNRPPVLSTCWLITAKALQSAGGFAAASHSISPESYLARSAIRQGDGYSFIRADETIDLFSAKSLPGQRATAVRTRYPQLHRRPELVALFSLIEIAALTLPFALLISSFLAHQWLVLMISAATSITLAAMYCRIVQLTYRRFLWRGVWELPLVALYDFGLLNYSLWRYEFREVIWKGRNVCVPLMRVIPNLPKVDRPTPGSGKRY